MIMKTITYVVLAAGLTACQMTTKQGVEYSSLDQTSNFDNSFNFDLIDRCLYGWTSTLTSDKQSKDSVLSLTEELAETKAELTNLKEQYKSLITSIENDRLKKEKAYAAFRKEWCSISDEGEKCSIE